MHWLKGISLGVIGLGLILSTPSQGQAIDFKVKGQWQINFGVSNVPDGRSRGSDSFMSSQRFRTTIEARASENVSATIGFTMPNNTANQAWGRSGSSMGADGVDVGVWQAYIDGNIPNTQIATRMGIQYLIMPGFVTGSNPVFSRNMPGISMHAPVWSNKEWNVGATFFWARPYNDNYSDPDETRSKTLDNLDVFALSVPITTQGLKINPWVIGAPHWPEQPQVSPVRRPRRSLRAARRSHSYPRQRRNLRFHLRQRPALAHGHRLGRRRLGRPDRRD